MHFHFPFGTDDILWTLTFAAHLVLLVVLLGRDRIKRFPWFTASIVILALWLLTVRLLGNKLPQLTLNIIRVVMADTSALVGLAVVVEIARRAFGRVGRSTWIIGAFALMILGAVVLKFWGPWPSWSMVTARGTMANLRLLQLIAQKTSLLVDVETIPLGLLIALLGSRFGAGWKSHTQQIVVGLSTTAIAQLVVQAIQQNVLTTAQANIAILQSMDEQRRVIGLLGKLSNTSSTIYIAVVIWWIVCLWRDEPGTVKTADAEAGSTAETNQPALEPGHGVPATE